MRAKYSDKDVMEVYEKTNKSAAATARVLKMDASSVRRRIKSIEKGKSLGSRLTQEQEIPVPETLKGRSFLRNSSTGEVMMEWVKTDVKFEHRTKAMEAAAEAFRESITPVEPLPIPKAANSELLNLFVLTDMHIGMLAWGEETDNDWDSTLAERTILGFFKEAIAQAPPAKCAVLGQLGDFLHYDSMDAVTPASKHLLDSDSRYAKLVRVAVRVIRQIINMLAKKYEDVGVVWAAGNHDPAGSIWMREMIAALYSNEPRVKVDCSPKPFYCVEHGKVSLFFYHGHKVKMAELDRVMAAEFRDVFGRTRFSYAHMGHLHHRAKESSLMLVEQHRTLASRDSYASTHGYKAGREANCITYHKEYGEVGRVVVTPEMLL